jgi:hypothetical protein
MEIEGGFGSGAKSKKETSDILVDICVMMKNQKRIKKN